MRQTANTIEERNSLRTSDKSGKPKSDKAERIKPYQFKKGQSGNPGGRPKNDVARRIAQGIFEGNEESIYKALGKALLKGNGYVFKELADRAYGKVSDKLEVSGDDVLIARLAAARKRKA